VYVERVVSVEVRYASASSCRPLFHHFGEMVAVRNWIYRRVDLQDDAALESADENPM